MALVVAGDAVDSSLMLLLNSTEQTITVSLNSCSSSASTASSLLRQLTTTAGLQSVDIFIDKATVRTRQRRADNAERSAGIKSGERNRAEREVAERERSGE